MFFTSVDIIASTSGVRTFNFPSLFMNPVCFWLLFGWFLSWFIRCHTFPMLRFSAFPRISSVRIWSSRFFHFFISWMFFWIFSVFIYFSHVSWRAWVESAPLFCSIFYFVLLCSTLVCNCVAVFRCVVLEFAFQLLLFSCMLGVLMCSFFWSVLFQLVVWFSLISFVFAILFFVVSGILVFVFLVVLLWSCSSFFISCLLVVVLVRCECVCCWFASDSCLVRVFLFVCTLHIVGWFLCSVWVALGSVLGLQYCSQCV